MASPEPLSPPASETEAPAAETVDLGIDATLMASLGRVVVLWGYVEMLLARLLAQFSGADASAMITVSSELPADTVAVSIARLARQKLSGEAAVERVLTCLTDVDLLRRERDMLVRGRWDRGSAPGTATILAPHPARREVMQVVGVGASDLAAIEDHAHEVVHQLTALCLDVGVRFDGSPTQVR